MDIMQISIMAYLMQAVANSDLQRSSAVETVPAEVGSPNAFEFGVSDDEHSEWGGTFRVTVERVS